MSGPSVLVIPAYNEGRSIADVLDGIAKQQLGLDEVLVIDDGSIDDTGAEARRAGARVIRHPFNMGYGAALQTGYKYALAAGASWVVQMDADGQHLPSEVPKLVAPVRAGQFDLVVGSRFLEDTGYEMGALRSVGRGLFGWIARRAGLSVTDPTSGFQALNRRTLELFVSDWYPADYPDVDVLLMAHRAGLRIQELAVEMAPGWRASTLHSGWRPLYYVYKMLLSLWAASAEPRRRGD